VSGVPLGTGAVENDGDHIEGPEAVEPPVARAAPSSASDADHARREIGKRSLQRNWRALLLNFYLATGVGYLGWLVMARMFDAADVGIALSAVSAVFLGSRLALLGLDASVVTFLPSHPSPTRLLNGFVNVVALGGLAASAVFLVLAWTVFQEVSVLASSPVYVSAILALGVFTAISFLLDATSLALRRSDDIVRRTAYAGAARVIFFVTLWWAALRTPGLAIVLAWVWSMALTCLVAYRQVRRRLPTYRYRLELGRRELPPLLRNGLANHALTLSVLGPQLLLPLIIVEVVSPAAGAYWYAVWMIALLARWIPGSSALALFSEAANQGEDALRAVSRSVRSSLLIVIPLSAVIALAAPLGLQTLGAGYAQNGTTPLRILAAGMIMLVFTEFYITVCRTRRRLAEPTVVYVAGGLLILVGSIPAGAALGLNGVALVWVAGETALGLWAAWRLHVLGHGTVRSQRGPVEATTLSRLRCRLGLAWRQR
jgi:O-antigen/teichoic acid export membrane protein